MSIKPQNDKKKYAKEVIDKLGPDLMSNLGGHYLMKTAHELAGDAKYNNQPELHDALMYIRDRINYTFTDGGTDRDIELNVEDIHGYLNEPQGKIHKANLPTPIINSLFEEGTQDVDETGFQPIVSDDEDWSKVVQRKTKQLSRQHKRNKLAQALFGTKPKEYSPWEKRLLNKLFPDEFSIEENKKHWKGFLNELRESTNIIKKIDENID